MSPVHHHQIHVTVYAPVKCEIRFLRVHTVVDAIVRFHSQPVCLPQQICHIHTECGIAAVMGAHQGIVEAYPRTGVHSPEFQIDPFLTFQKLRHVQLPFIPA